MKALFVAALCAASVGCSFGVKTCSPTDPCLGAGQCVQGVCTVGPSSAQDAGGGGGDGGGSGGGGGGGSGGGGSGGGGQVDAGPFDAGPLEGVVFLTPPRLTRAGVCSERIQIGVFEDAGVGEDGGVTPLKVDLANENALFFDVLNCTGAPVSEFVIPDSGIVDLYFLSTATGSVLVSARHDPISTLPVTQVESVVGATPERLVFSAPVIVSAGACSSLSSIQVRDGFGNMTSVTAELEVALSSSSTTTRFFAEADTTCLSPLAPATIRVQRGASSGFFRFVDSARGSPVFNASAPDAGSEALPVAPATSLEQTVL